MEALCKPAGGKEFAVLIDKLIRFARAFGVKAGDASDAVKFYREALSDIPADLLASAIDEVVRTYKWGHRLPAPADLLEAIEGEWRERKALRLRLGAAMKFGRELDRAEVSAADKQRALKAFEEAKNALTLAE